MAVKHITQDQFDEVTNQQGKKVLVDFFATWCGPCKMLAPMLEELSEKLPENCEIVKIDVDQNPEAARKFRVMSIPTAMLFENGQVATQYVDEDGDPTMNGEWNINGSSYAIEGITSPDGRILGKMGHSERYEEGLFQNIDGNKEQNIFANGVNYFRQK